MARNTKTYRGARRNAARIARTLRYWSLTMQKDRPKVIAHGVAKALRSKSWKNLVGLRECARRVRQMDAQNA